MSRKSVQLDNINLVRKIVWSFKKKTKEPFEDLFQVGYIGYLRALESYHPSKGAFSTHAWFCISSDIQDYLKSLRRKNALLQVVEDFSSMNPETPHSDFFDSLPEESLGIAKVILTTPKAFAIRSQEEARERICEILMNNGWPIEKVNFGIMQLKKACI